MNNQRSVLIVDRSEENCEVLRTVLERQGVRTFTAQRREEKTLLRQHRPDVIVLDTECDLPNLAVFDGENSDNSDTGQPSIILLGKVRRNRPVPRGEFIAKPYHYGPLIRRIEEMLEQNPRKVA